MQLMVLRSMWGAPDALDELVVSSRSAGFDGVEGPPPEAAQRRLFRRLLNDHGLAYAAEATTGIDRDHCERAHVDWWVPAPDKTAQDHLDDLQRIVDAAVDLGARFITSMTGYDAWPLQEQVAYFGRALELEAACPIPISFETHRCRSMFNPWITRDLIQQLPALKLTCDFSHWCVVCERLIDSEWAILQQCARHAFHVHARVGYAQGAQVPDPRPGSQSVYQRALAAHENWWDLIWRSQQQRGLAVSTLTPEFGPQGYWHTHPDTGAPTRDLWQIVQWQASRQRQRFQQGRWQAATQTTLATDSTTPSTDS